MAIADDIARLEGILARGVSEIVVDGVRQVYDLKAIERRLAQLRNQQTVTRRPKYASVTMSNPEV